MSEVVDVPASRLGDVGGLAVLVACVVAHATVETLGTGLRAVWNNSTQLVHRSKQYVFGLSLSESLGTQELGPSRKPPFGAGKSYPSRPREVCGGRMRMMA